MEQEGITYIMDSLREWNVRGLNGPNKQEVVKNLLDSSLGGIYVTVVYGSNNIGERETLWGAIDILEDKLEEPWMLARYFNNVLDFDDRIGGNPIHSDEIVAFQKCMDTNNLQEVRYIGNTYT